MRSKVKVKHNIPFLEDEDGSIAITDHEMAEVLNNFFSSVFTYGCLDSIPIFDGVYHGKLLNNIDKS